MTVEAKYTCDRCQKPISDDHRYVVDVWPYGVTNHGENHVDLCGLCAQSVNDLLDGAFLKEPIS